MRISDWSSDVCSSDLKVRVDGIGPVSIGDNVRDAKIDVEAKSTLSFPLTAKEGYSTANVRVRVEGNGFKVDRRYDLPVRPAWPGVLRARTQVLDELAAGSFGSGFASGLTPGPVPAIGRASRRGRGSETVWD